MQAIDLLFNVIAGGTVLAFIVLAAGTLAMRLVRQPVERARLIQISLASVFVAVIVSHLSWKPTIDLPWLPNHAHDSVAVPASKSGGQEFSSNAATTAMLVSRAPFPLDASGEPQTFPMASQPDLASPAAQPTRQRSVIVASTGAQPAPWLLLKSLIVIGFIFTSALHVAYLLLGYVLTMRLVYSATPVTGDQADRLKQILDRLGSIRIQIAVSDKVSVPLAWGIVRPTIVFPKKLLRCSDNWLQVEQGLLHEWKHIQRRDLITWQLANFCQALLWPHPFYWIMRRELRISQDQIADEFAIQRTKEQLAYAETLLEYSKDRHGTWICALTMAGPKSNLYRRVDMLLDHRFNLAGSSRKRVVLGFACFMTVVSCLLASLQLTYAASATNILQAVVQESGDRPQHIDSATEPIDHTGIVSSAIDGKPISDATVIVTRMNSKTWEEIAVTETKTDENGEYKFTIPVEQRNERYLYIMFDLRHETFAPRHCGSYSYSMITRNLQLGAEPWFKNLKMVPGEKISGRVIDENGSPVVDAALRFYSQAPAEDQFTGTSFSDSVTDAQGRFEATVTADGTARFSVIPREHCMKHVDVGTKRGDLGDVTLARGVSIKGKLLDAVGRPLEGLWVNLTETAPGAEAAYEAKRSSRTDANGEFEMRPLKPGKYGVAVETKATGALEKERYANFKDTPPPAVFVQQAIDVTEDSTDKPFVIQAVPHVYIRGQGYNSKSEVTTCHLPQLIGQFNGQFVWIRGRQLEHVGEFELMIPHGIEQARLSFTTNEHSGLTIQFGENPPSTQRTYEFDRIEQDIADIKIVRYVAPILQVKVVDESGNQLTNVEVKGEYGEQAKGVQMMLASDGPFASDGLYFEKQDDGIFRSSSLVPDIEFDVYAKKEGYTSERKKISLAEAKNSTVTLHLKPDTNDPAGSATNSDKQKLN